MGNNSLVTMSTLLLILITYSISEVKAQKPNVIIIFADDVGTGDVPGYWEESSAVNMPHLENLVAQGTTFTDAHSTPICAPSRYVLLSGNYQHRGVRHTGIWNVNYKTSNFWKGQKSIAEVLRDNGYHCGVFGKWHLGAKVTTKNGFTFKPADWAIKKNNLMLLNENHDWTYPIEQGPSHLGFDKSYVSMQGIQRPPFAFFRNEYLDIPNLNNLTQNVKYWTKGNHEMPAGISKIAGRGGQGSLDWDTSAYNMIIVNETEKFIEDHLSNNETSDKPFFAYLPLGAAHKPHSPPYEYLDGSPVAKEYPNDHMDILGELDMVMGSVSDILEKNNVMENTILIFTSDNGGLIAASSDQHGHFTSGPLRNGKGSIYEGGHRVPLTIRWDAGSIPKGEKRSHLIGLNDIFATICDLVGIPKPGNQAIDSISFANYIFNETDVDKLRTYLGVWTYENRLALSSIRKDNLKLVHNYETDEMELYDLDVDLNETTNMLENIDRTSNMNTIALRMFNKLKEFGPCFDSPQRFKVGQKFRKCWWFRKKKNRCYKYIQGIYHCRKTCATLSDRNDCGEVLNNNKTRF